ncbi:MAG: nif-specific transcriptional activator NifA, partial [Nitrospirae bacterium]|nr:nif-specific transcriptional activator NifA [Nitrospirota bacterium]
AMAEGKFREDLYYRLNVVPIFLPPLREKKEDIPMLAAFFLRKYNEENGRAVKIDPEAVRALMDYHWPGNVRELENTIERMVVMAESEAIHKPDVMKLVAAIPSDETLFDETPAGKKGDLTTTVESVERTKIMEALNRSGGVQAKAAKVLGISPRQIGYKMKKYKINLNTR